MLTGMNIDDFGIGEYPYKTVLKEKTCESLAYNLKSYGYKAYAVHDHEGSFYERNLVYPNLGFDVFDSVEYMWPEDYTAMEWSKDSVLTGEIEKALSATAGKRFRFRGCCAVSWKLSFRAGCRIRASCDCHQQCDRGRELSEPDQLLRESDLRGGPVCGRSVEHAPETAGAHDPRYVRGSLPEPGSYR